MIDTSEQARSELWRMYQNDWVFFIEHALGHMTWSKQREIIRAVQRDPKVAVAAAHGVSKTFSAAELAVAFINLFEPSRVITTAGNYEQVDLLLWAEIREIYRTARLKLGGRCYDGKCDIIFSPTHFAHGFSTDKPAKAEGHHSPNLMGIIDEAKGAHQWLWDAWRGAFTGGNWRWLVISTTDGVETGSEFHKCFMPGSDWHQIQVSAYDTPDVTGEPFKKIIFPEPGNIMKFERVDIPPRDVKIQLSGRQYIENALDPQNGWGKGSYLFNTKVKGEVIADASDGLVKMSQINKMFSNHNDPDFDGSGQKRAGIDVAWGGNDSTVCIKAKGNAVLDLPLIITSGNLDPTELIKQQCDEIEQYLDHDKEFELRIDSTSGGVGIVSEMQTRDWKVVPVLFGGKPDRPDEYKYQVDEMWFEVCRIVQDISCPNIPRLLSELVQRKKAPPLTSDGGRRRVESKKDYIKRGHASPDVADAFLLCFYEFYGRGYYGGEAEKRSY